MIEYAIMHKAESKYCFAIDKDSVCLRLRIAKNDTPNKIEVIYGGKYTFALSQQSAIMTREYEDRLFAYYTATIHLEDRRFVYVFKIENEGEISYYSEDGLSEDYDFTLSFYNCFQYAYINEIDIVKPIDWLKGATFYQIFIDRFNIGNKDKDMSYINLKWGDLPNPKSFAGGDIKGITDKLFYLNSLGINALYLTPVFKSISNHKYDISDYYTIDSQFGNIDDLKELVKSAHRMGMRVVLDAVFNHASEGLKEFQDVLKNGKHSAYYDWFIIKNDNPLEYECFAECKYMPKFNTSNKEVRNYLINIATYWIKECDIDGWRLDVSDEVSHAFWRELRSAVKQVKSDAVLIGENWHDANMYLKGDQFDSIMNYAFTKACLDFYAYKTIDAQQFIERLNGLLMRNTDTVNDMMLNLIDTHDTHRFLTQANEDVMALEKAIATLFFYRGVPCVFYGTENQMIGGYDPDCRRTFDWTKQDQTNTVKELIKVLTALKHDNEFNYANTKMFCVDNVIHILREGQNCVWELIINASENWISLPKGRVYMPKSDDKVLDMQGYAIVKRDK